MPEIKSEEELLALFADNVSGDITAADMQDMVVSAKVDVVQSLADVATTGDYDDLANKPSIPVITNKPSEPGTYNLTIYEGGEGNWTVDNGGGGDSFDQDLNTTNSVEFAGLTIGDLVVMQDGEMHGLGSTIIDGSGITSANLLNVANSFRAAPDGSVECVSLNIGNGSVILDGANLTCDASGNVYALSFTGNGAGLTELPNIFDQNLNKADTVEFGQIRLNQLTIGSEFGATNQTIVGGGDNSQVAWATLSGVAFNNDYNALDNLPTIPTLPLDASDPEQIINVPHEFSGDYNDLTNLPTIPTIDTGGILQGDGLGNAIGSGYGFPLNATDTNQIINVFSGDYEDLTNKPSYSDLTDAPPITLIDGGIQVEGRLITTADLVVGDSGANTITATNLYINTVNTNGAGTLQIQTSVDVTDGESTTTINPSNIVTNEIDIHLIGDSSNSNGTTGQVLGNVDGQVIWTTATNPFDQDLNTTDDATFNILTVASIVSDGATVTTDGSGNITCVGINIGPGGQVNIGDSQFADIGLTVDGDITADNLYNVDNTFEALADGSVTCTTLTPTTIVYDSGTSGQVFYNLSGVVTATTQLDVDESGEFVHVANDLNVDGLLHATNIESANDIVATGGLFAATMSLGGQPFPDMTALADGNYTLTVSSGVLSWTAV